MKLNLAFLVLSLFSSLAFAECNSQESSLSSLDQAMAIASCEEKFYSSQSTHNQAIDLHNKVAAHLTTADDTYSKETKCSELKEAKKSIKDTIKKYEECWKEVKKGIIACIHTPNIDAVVEAGNSCEKGLKTALNWEVLIKDGIEKACK